MGLIIFQITLLTTHQIVLGWPISVNSLACITSIGNSVDTIKFQDYVKEKLAKLEEYFLQKQHLTMDFDEDFANSFNNSQMVTSTSLFHQPFYSQERSF